MVVVPNQVQRKPGCKIVRGLTWISYRGLVAKPMAHISFVVTAKLICAFVFASAERWFSRDAANVTFHKR